MALWTTILSCIFISVCLWFKSWVHLSLDALYVYSMLCLFYNTGHSLSICLTLNDQKFDNVSRRWRLQSELLYLPQLTPSQYVDKYCSVSCWGVYHLTCSVVKHSGRHLLDEIDRLVDFVNIWHWPSDAEHVNIIHVCMWVFRSWWIHNFTFLLTTA